MTEAHRELAVKVALASGWERDVKALRQKVQELEHQNNTLADASMVLREHSAVAEGKELALRAEHREKLHRIEEELRASKQAGESAIIERAKSEASLKVNITQAPVTSVTRHDW